MHVDTALAGSGSAGSEGKLGLLPAFWTIIKREQSSLPEQLLRPQQSESEVLPMVLCKWVKPRV